MAALAVTIWVDGWRDTLNRSSPVDLAGLTGTYLGAWCSFAAALTGWAAVRGRWDDARLPIVALGAVGAGLAIAFLTHVRRSAPSRRRARHGDRPHPRGGSPVRRGAPGPAPLGVSIRSPSPSADRRFALAAIVVLDDPDAEATAIADPCVHRAGQGDDDEEAVVLDPRVASGDDIDVPARRSRRELEPARGSDVVAEPGRRDIGPVGCVDRAPRPR